MVDKFKDSVWTVKALRLYDHYLRYYMEGQIPHILICFLELNQGLQIPCPVSIFAQLLILLPTFNICCSFINYQIILIFCIIFISYFTYYCILLQVLFYILLHTFTHLQCHFQCHFHLESITNTTEHNWIHSAV